VAERERAVRVPRLAPPDGRDFRTLADVRASIARPGSDRSQPGHCTVEKWGGGNAVAVLDLFRLDGRVAIVTGAFSGLGVAFARALAGAGADVVLGARREDRLADTRELVETAGRRAIAFGTDVTDPQACQSLVDAALAAFGHVDVLVNCRCRDGVSCDP
jgi:short chain dehydrogenase